MTILYGVKKQRGDQKARGTKIIKRKKDMQIEIRCHQQTGQNQEQTSRVGKKQGEVS